jgi:hypothetical protein
VLNRISVDTLNIIFSVAPLRASKEFNMGLVQTYMGACAKGTRSSCSWEFGMLSISSFMVSGP